jgi:hypothetical protein
MSKKELKMAKENSRTKMFYFLSTFVFSIGVIWGGVVVGDYIDRDKKITQTVVENNPEDFNDALREINTLNYYAIITMDDFLRADSNRKIQREYIYSLMDKPYKMRTSFRDTSIVDLGTYKELDSLKCIRKAQMELVKQRRIKQEENKEKELELLNSPCKNNYLFFDIFNFKFKLN